MGLSDAHKGYEYQDLLTSYFIINDLLKGNSSEFKVDIKECDDDKFDDLTVINNNEVVKRQIKYSDDKIVAKGDFSSIDYDLALDVLYNSWEKLDYERDVSLKILLAWDYNDNLDFLEEIGTSNDFTYSNVKQYRINIDKIWSVKEERPISSWRRLRNNMEGVSRESFKEFLQDLKVELCLPKASLDIGNKGEMERITVDCLKDFGVGTYPNHEVSPENVLLRLMNIVKNARANQKTLKTHQVVSALGLVVGYGNIEQLFPVDLSNNIYDINTFEEFYSNICKNNKTLLIGEPGSGKSWFITNFIEYLKSQKILFARHYCYTSLDDIFYSDRITSNIFMANLIRDIMLVCPELKDIKTSKFGVDENELQSLIDHIDKEIVLIIDGLDHIERIKSSNESAVGANKTDIIEIIKRLNVPENVKIVVVSQPVSEVLELCGQNYTLTEIQNWDTSRINRYLEIRCIGMYEEIEEVTLSSYLFNKSNGNPLYVTYLVNELSRASILDSWMDILDSIPDYNDDLKGYYDYLLEQIDEDHKVVYVLSGASFYLSIEELKDITGLGSYVEKRIKILRSILKESVVNGGFIIYHESFRRYILELLERNGLSIYENIYKDLIMWLESIGVYSNNKAYNNLFRLLYELGQYDRLLEYANVEFVSESLFKGYGFNAIKKNSDYLVKAVTKKKSFDKLVILSELSNIVLNAEFDYEIYEGKYSMCIGQIHGFQWLSEILIYEGKANMPLKEGLRVCYSCSRNYITPPWDLYINEMLEESKHNRNINWEEEKEQLKYLTAASVDIDKNRDSVVRYATDSGNIEYMKIVLNEYVHRDRLVELISLITDMGLIEQWHGLIEGTDQDELDVVYAKDILNTVKTSDSIYGDAENKIKYLVENAMKIYETYPHHVDRLIEDITDLSWFHNWIIFVFQASKIEKKSEITGDDLVEIYSNLNRVTEVANHSIRTMDLYGLREEIYDTIQKPLRDVSLCEAEWKEILDIIVELSSDTMVTFQNAMMGPLTTDRLFDLVTEITNDENYDLVLQHFGEITEEQKTRRIHMDLADYYMQKCIFLCKNSNTDQGINEFRNAIIMIMSYGQRRDRTLSRLMDTVEDVYSIDSEKGRECIKRLGSMSVAVVRQTDGKETSNYENEWSQLLCKYEPELALRKFIVDSETYKRSWICENTLEAILTNWLTSKYSRIGNALFKTMPNKSSSDFIQAYINNIALLDNEGEVLLARTSIIDLISKFKFNDDAYEVEKQFIDPITGFCEKHGIDCNLIESEGYTVTPTTNQYNHTQITETFSNKYMDESNIYEVLDFMKLYGYSEEVSSAVKTYLVNKEELSQEVVFVINQLVDFAFENPVSSQYSNIQEEVIYLGGMDEIINSIKAYINLRIYLTQKDSWYHKYSSYEFFEKAYNLDKRLVIDSYFDYFGSLNKPFEGLNGLSGNIIKMLSCVDNGREEVLDLWDIVYDVIDLRLSCRSEIEWEKIEREFEGYCIEELLHQALLTRLRYGTADIHKSVFASLESILTQDTERAMFIRPFKRVLTNHSKYINLSVTMLIQLVEDMYSYEEREQYQLLDLDDYICTNECGDEGFLLKFLLGKEMIETVKPNVQTTDQGFNDFILQEFKSIYPRYKLLEDRGISVDDYILGFFGELHSEINRKILSETYMDSKSSLLMDNIQIHSDYLKSIGNAVINHLSCENKPGNVFSILRSLEEREYFYHSIREDILLLNAISNSTITRPNGIPHPKDVNDSVSSVDEGDWIRLAYIEREYVYTEDLWRAKHIGDNCKIFQTCSAVGFGKSNRLPLYHDSYRGSVLEHIYPKYMYPAGLKGKEIVVFTDANIGYNPFMTYFRYDYLALTFEVLSLLEITMTSNDKGLIGIDSEGKCVLKYQNWCTYKHLTGEHERTPVLRGSQLLLSKEIFDKLVSEIGHEPYCHTTSELIFGK
ncbi:ATP-binding protein [Candidatus Galacturonibacter soehngenii]|uniref:ATP-binding protein n=1 Tax=Candidatus Galacturonatibacter soehngenii TaxID=2307010 RepID=A0A7V7QJ03_9FIRM|nr:ATP-binding protein [Candidatus Galacturonibacter soehngenii]KAB1435946.1 ATP-binding protein [Candidatus Galacturonibacter soehngenii]